MLDRNRGAENILEEVLNNTTARLKFNSSDYIILIKKQEGKQFCTFFLTDCSDNIWIEKIDIDYCEKLKTEMNVKTSINTFAWHFVQAVKKSCTIQELQPLPVLKMQLKISEGLIINCTLSLQVQMNSEESPAEYKKLLRIFFLQLYQAKQSQIKSLQKKLQIGDNEEADGRSLMKKNRDDNFIKSVLNIPEKKEAPSLPTPKNRDLINPLRKKRRQHGLKLTGE